MIEMVITMIESRGGSSVRSTIQNLYRPLIATTDAWIPHQQRLQHQYSTRRITSRSGDNGASRSAPPKILLDIGATRSSTTSTIHDVEKKEEPNNDTDALMTEAMNMALSICGDELSVKASSAFGGLKYYNTDIDNRFRVLFVLGGPGSGKGTQSALMEQNYPVAHFSVGELLRNVPEHSPHKATIDAKLVTGQIVPVEISLSLLKAAMEAVPSKHTLFLVDGFPRNYDNLSGWCRVMNEVAALESVLVYQCPFPVLQERILERAKISGRSDDNIESVKKRFFTFENETIPVVQILRSVSENCPMDRKRWSVVDIHGDRSLEEVWTSTQQILNHLIQSDVLTANIALLSAVQAGDAHAYENLCDPSLFMDTDVVTFMQQQECTDHEITDVQSTAVEIISGREVAVTYDRFVGDALIREKRVWNHQGAAGWRSTHVSRTPTSPTDADATKTD